MRSPRILLILCVLSFTGCTTKDFRVVDALRVGMTREEAKTTIQSYGFSLRESFNRPADGWPKKRKTFDASEWRAGREEEQSGKRITLVEFYPVGHGLFGAGQLFLFFGEDGRLASYYRYQIN